MRLYVGIAGFIALANQHDAECLVRVETFGDHLTVARLEDVQIQGRSRKQDRVEREHPQARRAHALSHVPEDAGFRRPLTTDQSTLLKNASMYFGPFGGLVVEQEGVFPHVHHEDRA